MNAYSEFTLIIPTALRKSNKAWTLQIVNETDRTAKEYFFNTCEEATSVIENSIRAHGLSRLYIYGSRDIDGNKCIAISRIARFARIYPTGE